MNIKEQFEKWSKSHYVLKELPVDFEDGEYVEPEMQYAYESWEASRAALLKCACCGLTDTEIQKVCHNSDCAEYAQEETLFKGWK